MRFRHRDKMRFGKIIVGQGLIISISNVNIKKFKNKGKI